MSKRDYQEPRVVVVQQSSNAFGIAGFVLSVLGLLTCGTTSILGFIFSFIGLFKEPKGLAIAGLVLGLPGLVFFGLIGVGMVMGFLGIGALAVSATQILAVQASLNEVHDEVHRQLTQNSQATIEDLRMATSEIYDPWGNTIRLVEEENRYVLRCLGPDEEPKTDDDVTRFVSKSATKRVVANDFSTEPK